MNVGIGIWDWDPDIPFLGIFVSKFRYFVFAVLHGSLGYLERLGSKPDQNYAHQLESTVYLLFCHACFRFWNSEIDDGDGYLTPNELQILEAKANFVRNSSVN